MAACNDQIPLVLHVYVYIIVTLAVALNYWSLVYSLICMTLTSTIMLHSKMKQFSIHYFNVSPLQRYFAVTTSYQADVAILDTHASV